MPSLRRTCDGMSRPSLRNAVLDLTPAYFALVMATGIVAIAVHDLIHVELGYVMFYLNVAFYIILVMLHLARAIWHPRRCLDDLHDPAAGPGYYTWIAGTSVLGTEFVVFEQAHEIAMILLIVAVVLSATISYTVYTALTLRKVKPGLAHGINGGWLIAVVAMQSLVVLAIHLSGHWGPSLRLKLEFSALAMWLAGVMLYLWLGLLIFYRCLFLVLSPKDVLPTYWINMGALAISTLAGSVLIKASVGGTPYLDSLAPFIKGITIFCWAGGTWWIPLLVILGFWRHVVCRIRLTYNPLYWGLVFPLGMYAAATNQMSQAMHLSFLRPLPVIFCVAGLLAWTVTFIGMVKSTVVWLRAPAQPPNSKHP